MKPLYKRAESSFTDRPSSASDVPCHNALQGLAHPRSVASEAPNYPPKEDSRATGRGSSSDVLSHRGGSTEVPGGSVGHRTYQPMDEAEEETRSQTGLQAQSVT